MPGTILYDLPAQLRNKIYEFALVSVRPVRIPKYPDLDPNIEPPRLGGSRQVRAEALSVYFLGIILGL